MIARHIGDMLIEADAKTDAEKKLRDRFDYSLALLAVYGKGLRLVRESQVPNYTDFDYGMS